MAWSAMSVIHSADGSVSSISQNNKLKFRNNELEIEVGKAMNAGSDLDSGYLQV